MAEKKPAKKETLAKAKPAKAKEPATLDDVVRELKAIREELESINFHAQNIDNSTSDVDDIAMNVAKLAAKRKP